MPSLVTKGELEGQAGGLEGYGPRLVFRWSTKRPLHHSDQQDVHLSPSSRIWTCDPEKPETPQWVVWWMTDGVQGQAHVYR